MIKKTLYTLLLATTLAFSTYAQDNNALIDALVKKGVLSKEDAVQIQDDMQQQQQKTPGGFLQVGSSAVRGLRIYGDVRLRYQWDDAQTPHYAGQKTNYGPDNDKNRYRYRVRLGADYQFADNWKAGVRLETSPRSNTASVDFGGFSSKDAGQVYFGLLYLEYESATPMVFGNSFADYADLRMGRHVSPFMLPMEFWCADFNPVGFSEQVGWKDVGTDGLGLTLRGGEYITSNVNEASGLNPGTDQALLMAQSEFKYKLDKDMTITVAPVFMYETNGHSAKAGQDGGSSFDGGVNPVKVGTTDDIILGHMSVLQIPVEYAWKAFNKPNKVYADWGVNFSADERAKAFGMKHGEGNQLFNVGYQIGDTAKKGHWQLGVEYRYVESMAYDPYLLDTTYGLGYSNQQGVVVSGGYAFADNIWGVVSLYMSNPIRGGSATPVTGINADTNGNLIGSVTVVQVDLNWKF
jgi:hypothetical protein